MTTKTRTGKTTKTAPSAGAAAAASSVPAHIQAEMIEDLQAQLAESNAKVAALSRAQGTAAPAPAPRPQQARNVPVAGRSMVDAGDMPLGHVGDVILNPTGDARSSLERPSIEVPDGPPAQDFLTELAFMNELVTVTVHESSDPLAEPLPEIRCNGRLQIFPRGQEVVCRRCFVEVLARAKPVHYGSVEYVDNDGNKAVKYPQRKSLRYPFSVNEDANPRGRAWLKKVLAEA
jgi:hypothetical protein